MGYSVNNGYFSVEFKSQAWATVVLLKHMSSTVLSLFLFFCLS
ncbi:hypothetical protein DSUL_60064 [Desulfovibrionales bacterium]